MLDMIRHYLHTVVNQEEGQDLAEYALLAVFIAIVVAAVLPNVGNTIMGIFNDIIAALGG